MNFMKILKSEIGTMITVFLSLLIAMMLMTFIWEDDYTIHVPFGVLDQDNSALSRSILSQLDANQTVDINFYAQSEEDLIHAIKEKRVNGGLIIPKNFGNDVVLRKSPKVLILADGTNIMTGGSAYGAVSSVIGTMNAGTQMKMMEGRNMSPSVATTNLGTFSYVERLVYEPIGNYTRKMVYTLVPLVLLQTFCVKFFLPLLIKKREEFCVSNRKETIQHIVEIVVRVLIISIVGMIASYVTLFVIDKLHGLPLRGNILLYYVSMGAFMLNVWAFGMVCGAITSKLAYFVQVYSMSSTMIVFAAGITYPYFLIPDSLMKVIHWICPLAPLSVELKALSLKGIGWDIAMPYLLDSLRYTFVWLFVGILLYTGSILLKRYNRKKAELQEVEV